MKISPRVKSNRFHCWSISTPKRYRRSRLPLSPLQPAPLFAPILNIGDCVSVFPIMRHHCLVERDLHFLPRPGYHLTFVFCDCVVKGLFFHIYCLDRLDDLKGVLESAVQSLVSVYGTVSSDTGREQ